MGAHPNTDLRIFLQRLADFHGATDWLLRAFEEEQNHSVASRQSDQLAVRLCSPDAGSLTDYFIEQINEVNLLVDEELGIAHDIDGKDVSDFGPKGCLCVRGHLDSAPPS